MAERIFTVGTQAKAKMAHAKDGGIAAQYTALAQNAAGKKATFTNFVEELLTAERVSPAAQADHGTGEPGLHSLARAPIC